MIKHFKIDFLRRSVVVSNDVKDAPDGAFLERTTAVVFGRDGDAWLVYKDNITVSTLVHECVHIVHELMRAISQSPELLNDEFEAYLMEYVFSECYWLLFGDSKMTARENKTKKPKKGVK